MPSKKSIEEKKVPKKSRSFEEIPSDFLEEDEEEEENIDYILDENAEEKIEQILSTSVALVPTTPEPQLSAEYPTETHMKNRVKYIRGDECPPFNDTLILRKP